MMLDNEGLHTDRPASTITTWTGRQVDVLDMNVNDVDVRDIAHALARQCRYNGHTDGYLSVARHSLWVSNRLSPHGSRMQLWGLLHDASETYLGDMVKPLKHSSSMSAFRLAETCLDAVIARKFGLPFPMPDEVHEADRYVTVEIEIGLGRRHAHRTTYEQDEAAFIERYERLERELAN